jgi:outer membrane protein assembly factor BamA
VKITNEPGSAPDRVVINVDVEEQSTGDFSVMGGYSTADGFMGQVSVSERYLLERAATVEHRVHLGNLSAASSSALSNLTSSISVSPPVSICSHARHCRARTFHTAAPAMERT